MRSQKGGHHCPNDNSAHQVRSRLRRYQLIQSCCLQFQQPKALVSGSWRKLATKKFAVRSIGEFACIQGQFGDNHKVKLGKNRSKTNGVKLSKMASGLWVSLRYFPWRKSKTRLKQLIKLDVNKRDALGAAKSGKGPWRLSRTVPAQRGLSIEFLAEQGCLI